MARARYSYRVDVFYRDEWAPDGVRQESHTIAACDDEHAIREAKITSVITPPSVAPQIGPAFFRVRKVFRKREEVIFDSSKVHPSSELGEQPISSD